MFNANTMSSSDLDTSNRVLDIKALTSHFQNAGITLGGGTAASSSGANSIGIAASAITSTELADGSVIAAKIGTGSVASSKINSGLTTGAVSPVSGTQSSLLVSASSTASSQAVGATGGYTTNKVKDLYADSFAHSRSSELSTMPRLLANVGGSNYTSGSTYAVRCVYTGNQPSHQFSNARCFAFATGTVTQFVLAVWNSAGTLITNGYTNNLTLTNSALTSGALQATITLTPGAVYYVGLAMVFSAVPTLMGSSTGRAPVVALSPVMLKTGTGFSSGAPGSISDVAASSTGISLPWVELY